MWAESRITSADISKAVRTLRKQWKPLPYSILFKKWGEHMKQKNYMAGLYYRLSQEDERQGESVSIDNQRTMLRKYAEEHGIEIYDEYIDDGLSLIHILWNIHRRTKQ